MIAGYAMNTLDIGRGRLQAGLRVEGDALLAITGYHVTLDAKGHYVSTESGFRQPQLQRTCFRACNTGSSFDPITDIRLAYGMGIARPHFGDLPPFIVENDKKIRSSVGNP